MVSLVMLVIIAACAALLYTKGTLMQGVTLVFNALIAGFVAFAFYETLGDLLAKYAAAVAGWSQMISFLLLFILVVAILQTVTMQLGKEKMDLGLWPERVGRVVSGILLGYIITGYLLVALALAPLPNKYPYARFEERNPNPSDPSKAMFSPDGFVSGLFATVSKGSFAALGSPQSFAVLHADYLNHLYLNRHNISQEIPVKTSVAALSVPSRAGVWEAPSTLRDADGQALSAQPGTTLMLVRMPIKKSALKDAGKFSFGQIRLICVPKSGTSAPLAGHGEVVYPFGYIGVTGALEKKSLHDTMTIEGGRGEDRTINMDLAFYVPSDLTPALIGFKGNNLEKLSKTVSGEEAPQPVRFGGSVPAPEAENESAPPTPEP